MPKATKQPKDPKRGIDAKHLVELSAIKLTVCRGLWEILGIAKKNVDNQADLTQRLDKWPCIPDVLEQLDIFWTKRAKKQLKKGGDTTLAKLEARVQVCTQAARKLVSRVLMESTLEEMWSLFWDMMRAVHAIGLPMNENFNMLGALSGGITVYLAHHFSDPEECPLIYRDSDESVRELGEAFIAMDESAVRDAVKAFFREYLKDEKKDHCKHAQSLINEHGVWNYDTADGDIRAKFEGKEKNCVYVNSPTAQDANTRILPANHKCDEFCPYSRVNIYIACLLFANKMDRVSRPFIKTPEGNIEKIHPFKMGGCRALALVKLLNILMADEDGLMGEFPNIEDDIYDEKAFKIGKGEERAYLIGKFLFGVFLEMPCYWLVPQGLRRVVGIGDVTMSARTEQGEYCEVRMYRGLQGGPETCTIIGPHEDSILVQVNPGVELLLERLYGVSDAVLVDTASQAHLLPAYIEPSGRYRLVSNGVSNGCSNGTSSAQSLKPGSTSGAQSLKPGSTSGAQSLKPGRQGLTTSAVTAKASMEAGNEIAQAVAKWHLGQSSGQMKAIKGFVDKLASFGIQSFDDVRSANDLTWASLNLPIGLRRFLESEC